MPRILELPEIIEKKLTKEERHEIIVFINQIFDDTKEDLKINIIDIIEARFEKKLTVEISTLRNELIEKIADSNSELRKEIANSRVDLIKWMFIFWIGNVFTIIGSILGILKLAGVI